MCHEQLWKLKEDAVAGIRVDDQLRARNVLRERVRIEGRDHHVMMSIHDQGRLGNVLEFYKAFSSYLAPFSSRCSLSCHRLRRTRRINVPLPFVPTLPERSAGSLARRSGAKEQIQKGVEAALTSDRVCRCGILRSVWILRRVAASRTCRHENHATHERAGTPREALGYVAANRAAEDINLRESQRTHERDGVVRH